MEALGVDPRTAFADSDPIQFPFRMHKERRSTLFTKNRQRGFGCRMYSKRYVPMNSANRRLNKKRGLQAHILSYVMVNLLLVVFWWLLTPEVFFWPLFSLAGWGIGLAFHIWAVRALSDGAAAQRD
jgi:hypothetical protein